MSILYSYNSITGLTRGDRLKPGMWYNRKLGHIPSSPLLCACNNISLTARLYCLRENKCANEVVSLFCSVINNNGPLLKIDDLYAVCP